MKRTWVTLLVAMSLALIGASAAGAQSRETVALTPVIGVAPTSLDFGRVCQGQSRDLTIDLFNDVSDPASILTITALSAGAPFSLVSPPATPFPIPGDGTHVTLTVRYTPSAGGPQAGTLSITAQPPITGPNPRLVPLSGSGNRAPLCNAGGPYTGTVGQPVSFNGGGSSDPDGDTLTYLWNFGDGATATGATPTHTYATGGLFTVTLTVNDGCTTAQCSTTADINAPPVCNAGGPYTGTVGQPVSFNGGGSSDPDGTIVSYVWNFGDGSTGTGATPSHTYATSGLFTVTLTVTDNDGASSTCTTTADINAPPICNANGPYTGTVGQPVSFNGSASSDPDGTIVSYVWNFGDGSTGTGATPTHTYATGGVFTVTLTVTDNDGASSSCQTTADINTPPNCNAGGPYNGTIGVPVQFDGTGSSDPDGTIASYAWNFGDGATGSGPSPTHTYATAGNFTVTLTVTDNDGATSTCTTTANITETPNEPPLCDAGGPYTGTEGVPVTFDGSGSSDPDGTVDVYAWDFGDGSTGTGVSPTHTYAAAGTYTVELCVTDNDGATSCCQTSATIAAGPNQPPICDAGGPYSGDENTPIQFDGTGSSDPDGTIVLYEWDFGDGTSGTGATPTHSYAVQGSYIAQLCVTDDDSARSCCTADVTVLPPSAVELSRFTATAGGGVVSLNWTTASELLNLGFYVERADDGNTSFVRLNPNDRIPALGNGNQSGDYTYVDRTVAAGHSYVYRLVAVDRDGHEDQLATSLEVAVSNAAPTRLVLNQNQPNPFNPSTTISFALPEAGHVTLRIYDAQGHLVRTLVNEDRSADYHAVEWDGRDDAGASLGSGVYLYRLETARTVLQQKMVLMK